VTVHVITIHNSSNFNLTPELNGEFFLISGAANSLLSIIIIIII
jgi:hypothetical protein